MPGLLNRATGAALPLTASDVTTYVSGYALGLTASLTYGNLEAQPFQGLFVYPMDEYTTVVGFEAVIADRVVTIQIKDKAKLDRSHLDIRSATVTGNIPQEGVPIAPHSCAPGKVALDEDLERILFVVNLGTIAPMENVTIFISTSSELPTLPSGAVSVMLPAICAPTVPQFCSHRPDSSSQQAQGKDPHCFGIQTMDSLNGLCLATLLDTEVTNPMEYEFNFQLEIRGPCLLAGVESPTHEIRADAAPSAHSAKSIIITLANKHTFDRPVEILLHPSEPHMPHVLVEKGDMTLGEFDQHLKGKADFIRGTKKDGSAERKTEVIRKRLHKDIPHHSVIMLNFCPDLQSVQPNLRKTHGEFLFLVDRSSSVSRTSIQCVKEAMLVALKSLRPACLFNIIGFGSTFKTVFTSSQIYNEENLAMACNCIQRIRADMGSTNILSPLKWIFRQPVHQGHPRLLFLFTDGAVSNTGKVLELVRNHASSTRCYSFGIGPSVCYRLVKGLASVSKGSAEFLTEGERLQPKMIKSLKKAMAPMLSDVTVEWVFPETTEVLISPVSTSSLFPGDRLMGYGIVCDASLYISNSRYDKRRKYGMLHAQDSSSSVFYHSQDEGLDPGSGTCAKIFNSEPTQDAHPCNGDSPTHHGLDVFRRRRAYSTNQISSQKACPRATTASDPTGTDKRHPLRKAKVQDLANQSSSGSQRWQIDLQPLLNSSHDLSQGPRLHGPGARRPSLLPQGCQRSLFSGQEPQAWSPKREMDPGSSPKSAPDSRGSENLELLHHPSTLETETSSDWEPMAESEEQVSPCRPATPGPVLGKALVKGLCDNQRLQWEVSFELEPPALQRRDAQDADMWSETFHHLAARAIIRDFEQLAEREDEIELGSNRRYQVNAVHTSKACNVISKYTAFVPVDINKRRYLPAVVKYPNSGAMQQMVSFRNLTRHWKSSSAGAGRSQTVLREHASAAGDSKFQTLALEESPTSTFNKPLSPGREKQTAEEGPPHNTSTSTPSSMKTSETLFVSKLNLSKPRLLTRAAKGFLSKSLAKAPEPTRSTQSFDYIPLVSLQLASGAFLLNQAFCDAIQIHMEKLKWTSPFICLRMSLVNHRHDSKNQSPQHCPVLSSLSPPCEDTSLESQAEGSSGLDSSALLEFTGKLWATVVALAWLEHNSASYFIEWELVAAKASSWLEQQKIPEGRTLGALKATARQLFVLLRHWDENLEFNMLCYNPNYV
ncbi:von Willebrand factor A domain-containing protein 5B1 isoform X1 [Peromyscus californicus insignis]|uniref:von Willebrand factor A domain-containing protein 5B1 isoform X1 n=1 Tax=Peromyscus californicus insignis TaxID=564181 RepID=UPI0022A7FF28|nr:von Willebrand factor A domain-containing protein 5B1 isoform X1 [Peromyscus californicus insignis]XP_052572460.1 von Willebrand factor A domain-containing protein 5B1 isoform X1 [Peromyscus californicus insignis]